MSMTNQEVIDRALYEIGVLGDGESADATKSADALEKLNQMMQEWILSDKDLRFFPQDTLGDTCPIPIWAEDAVINNLAVKCAPAQRVGITAEVYDKAKDGANLVARTCINLKLENTDMSHLPRGQLIRHHILTDT